MQLLKCLICLPVVCAQLVQALDIRLPADVSVTELQRLRSINAEPTINSLVKRDDDCNRVLHLPPNQQWKAAEADSAFEEFEQAWAKDARYCDECRGFTKEKCDEQYDSDEQKLPDECKYGIKQMSYNSSWAVGAQRWFSLESQNDEICEAGEVCFDVPRCQDTHGAASYLILRSIRHFYDHITSIRNAAHDARTNVGNDLVPLYDDIALTVHPDTHKQLLENWGTGAGFATILAFTVLAQFFAGNEKAAKVNLPIAGLYLLFNTIPLAYKTKQEVETLATPQLPQEMLHTDLTDVASRSEYTLKYVTDELFNFGRLRSVEHPDIEEQVSMVNLLKNGSYSGIIDTHHEMIRSGIEKDMIRTVVLREYQRQGFKLFFVPTVQDDSFVPEFLTPEDHHLKGHKLMDRRCHEQYHIQTWHTREHLPWKGWPHDLHKHCEDEDWTDSVLSRNGQHYQPMLALEHEKECHVAQVPGASTKVFNGTTYAYGRITLEEFLGPVLDAALGLEYGGTDGLPVDTFKLLNQLATSAKTEPFPKWPLCKSYTEWAKSDTWKPIEVGCWDIEQRDCHMVPERT